MSVQHIPVGFHTITPNIIVESAEPAIEFYKLAFDAQVQVHLTLPNGSTAHCELVIGDSRLNLGEATEGWPVQPLVAQLYVKDSDEVFNRAVDAGATVLMPVTDMFFGSREGRVVDPFGSTWTISTRIEDVTPEEMQRRLDAAASEG